MSKASKANNSENYENSTLRTHEALHIVAKILTGIVALVAVAFLLCIFLVKSNFSVSGYTMNIAHDENSIVLPNGSIFVSKMIVSNSAKSEIAVDETVVFIDEKGTELLGRINACNKIEEENQENQEKLLYTINASDGISHEIEPVALMKTVPLYIPYVGYAIDFIVTPLGLICCVAIPLFILLVIEIINLIRLPNSMKKQEEEALKQELFAISKTPDKPAPITVSSTLSAFDKAPKPPSDGEFFAQKPHIANIGNTNINAINAMIEDVGDNVELVNKPQDSNPVSYKKPKEVIETPQSKVACTREFYLPLKKGMEKPDLANFSADLKEESPNHFCIDGIDIRVEPDNIKLSTLQNVSGRDISITVTKDYTNVSFGGEDVKSELDFALFRDETDDEQKVIIRKKSK